MRVSAWNANATYGFLIGHPNRDKYFDRSWSDVVVEIDGEPVTFPLSPSFWRKCPEIRGRTIKAWLKKEGHLGWPDGRPPKFELRPIGGNRFRLVKP